MLRSKRSLQSATDSDSAPDCARTTISNPCGYFIRKFAAPALTLRAIRWRITELPTLPGVITPIRVLLGICNTVKTASDTTKRRPFRFTRRRSALRCSRCWRGSTGNQTARRLRPLRRRAERTARPARVRIRRRKPWVLARRRLFGWKVRLDTVSPSDISWAGESYTVESA